MTDLYVYNFFYSKAYSYLEQLLFITRLLIEIKLL